MKKIILVSALTLSTVFAFDIASTAATVGNSMGITAESIGTKLANIVKEKAPETAAQAKTYCIQASTYKSFVGIADDGIMAKAIDICAEKSSEGLETTANEVKEKATSESTSSTSVLDTASKLLGN